MLHREISGSESGRAGWRRLLGLGAIVLALLAESASAVPMLVIDLGGQGASGSATVGQVLNVSVSADQIPVGSDGNGLFGFGFLLSIAPATTSIGGVAIAPQWTGLSSISVTSGSVGVTANLLGASSGPSGSGIALASFGLTALAPGVYALSLAALTGPGDNVLFDGTELDGTASFFTTATLTVLAPEPALGLLLALAAAVHRRR